MVQHKPDRSLLRFLRNHLRHVSIFLPDSKGNGIKPGTVHLDPAGQVCWTTTSTVTSPTCGTPATGATKYGYDANGNRTGETPGTGTATTYGYNAAGELTTITGATTASYAYDGDGIRTSKTTTGTTTKYTWDARGKVPQLLADGTSCYVYGPTGAVIEQTSKTGTAPTDYFTDTHGSTAELTNSTGTVTGTYAYSPWGSVTAHTGAATPFQFAGAFADAETGLLYLIHRYYDPTTALFLSVDALVAKTLSAYGYAGNNPLDEMDPLGLWGWGDWLAVGLMAVTAVAIVALAATGIGVAADVALGAVELSLGAEVAADAGAAAVYAESSAQSVALSESLALEEGFSGEGYAMAGRGASKPIDDIDRLTATYGGNESDWAKMASEDAHEFPGTRGKVQVHWYENVRTGCRYEPKLK